MAILNEQGNVVAHCAGGCSGARAAFSWTTPQQGHHGAVSKVAGTLQTDWRLFRCTVCDSGAIGVIEFPRSSGYPGACQAKAAKLIDFYPERASVKALPPGVPEGLVKEFREAERCLAANCPRAAAGMARSVLDKTLRANGYKLKKGTPLEQQIDAAAKDGVITAARKKRAHDEIRVLGNDVLHEAWQEIDPGDVDAALHYAQRVLEDFYDDRPSVLGLIKSLGKTPHEDDPSLLTSNAED
jgi:hypothetical protein